MTDYLVNDTDQPEGVPIAEAMQRLKLSESSVRRRIRAKTLRAYKVHTPQGHEWRIILDDQPTMHLVSTDDQAAGDDLALTRQDDQMGMRLVMESLRDALVQQSARIAALELLVPEYGPRDPGPPVDLPREIIEDGAIVPLVEPKPAQGIWARVVALFGGRG